MTAQDSNDLTSSEGDFLKAFLKVDDNVRDLIGAEDEGWLYNKILSLRDDANVADDLSNKLSEILKPMEDLLKKQDWFNWAGFICWDYFRNQPIVLETFLSPKISECRYEFAKDLYKQENLFNRENGFQDILVLTFTEEVKSRPILLEWKRRGSSEERNIFSKIYLCEVNALNDLLEDENLNNKFEDLLAFVESECEKEPDDQSHQQLVNKIKAVTDLVLDKYPEIVDSETKSLGDALSKTKAETLFTQKEFLNVLFWNRCFDDTWQYILYVPGAFLNDMGVGGIVFAGNELPGVVEYRLIEQTINRVFGEVAIVFGAVESRLKERAETIRAPFHEFSTISDATRDFINAIEKDPVLSKAISNNTDANIKREFEKAKFYNEYARLAYSYFKHRGSNKSFVYDETTELRLETIKDILNSMYKPALGYTIVHWEKNSKYKPFISSHKGELYGTDYNIKEELRLSHLQIEEKWQTAFFVGSFILNCNMLEHGIKAMSGMGNLIHPWHEVAFLETSETRTFSFRNIYSPDQVTYNELLRIKNRFERGDPFDYKKYGGLLVLDTIFDDFRAEKLEIKITFLECDERKWVSFDLILPNEAFEEV